MVEDRDHFNSNIGFIAAAAGSAVGLGNIWGFPFEVGQGGGAIFLFIYLFFCLLLCLPVMITEIAIGRSINKNTVGAFNDLGYSKWNLVGKLGVLSSVLILSYYIVIAGWTLGYILEMVGGNLTIAEKFDSYKADIVGTGAYGLIFIFTTAYIVSKGISKGIEKAAKYLMPMLVLMILLLTVYVITLPDALAGIRFYLIPDFDELTGGVIVNAMGQAFFHFHWVWEP